MARIFLAGHRGMVGSAILRVLEEEGVEVITASRDEPDLTEQSSVRSFFKANRPDQVIIAAAKVGGISANSQFPAQFIYENLMIESNLIHQSYRAGIEKLLFLGSSCIYPKQAQQPIRECDLMTGALEPTNEPYAIAKIAGIKLCESYNRQYGTDYRSVMPTNLYGPHDYFHPKNSHVLPGLMLRFHGAATKKQETVEVWGSGAPRREFLYVDDMAAASLVVLRLDSERYRAITTPTMSHINVGYGSDITIKELSEIIAGITGFEGQIMFDASQPDGPPRKLLDVSVLSSLGWKAQTKLEDGIRITYEWFLQNLGDLRR